MTDVRHADDAERRGAAQELPPSVAIILAQEEAPPAAMPEAVERIMHAVRLRPVPRSSPATRSRRGRLVQVVRARPRFLPDLGLRAWRGALAAAIVGAVGVGGAVAVRKVANPREGTGAGGAIGAATSSVVASARSVSHEVHLAMLAPGAHRVAVVGDFNSWRAQATPMQRDPATALWTVRVTLPAGRYMYAYLVDDARWMSDPNAPLAPGDGFGRQSSVLVVSDRYAAR